MIFQPTSELLSSPIFIKRYKEIKLMYKNNVNISPIFKTLDFFISLDNCNDIIPEQSLYVFSNYIINHNEEKTVYVLGKFLCSEILSSSYTKTKFKPIDEEIYKIFSENIITLF